MFLLTAGEVLLGTAIIMGLSALVTLLLRACTRRRMPRNGRDIPDLLDALERNENRASLTSLQRTVISKLRDRPPRYETRHNYEYRQREGINRNENLNLQQNNQEASDRRLIAVLNPSANRRNEPPPPYEPVEDSHSVSLTFENMSLWIKTKLFQIHELPPAYTIRLSIHDETTFRSGEDLLESVCRGTNPSPLCSNNQEQEQEEQNERRNEALENNIVEHDTRPNIISNRTCDSILYIWHYLLYFNHNFCKYRRIYFYNLWGVSFDLLLMGLFEYQKLDMVKEIQEFWLQFNS